MGRLENKAAVVTGAAMGIGQAAALALAREGALVAVSDINADAGQATVAAIQSAGGQAYYQRTDVAVTADVQNLMDETVRRFGKLDILVNNVGIAVMGTVTDISEDNWNRVLDVNLTSIWRGMKFAIPHMIRNGGGSIVNTSSLQSMLGFKGWSAYAAAKGGINALTQQAAIEYAPYHIRINAVAPGTIMTPMNERIFAEAADKDALIRDWNNMHPLGRFGQPREVADLIVFLASDEASFMTGDIIRVDGGAGIKGA